MSERIINQYGIDMTDWPITHYGSERACKHGVGHPAPDRKHHSLGVHGCDGCCSGYQLGEPEPRQNP